MDVIVRQGKRYRPVSTFDKGMFVIRSKFGYRAISGGLF